MPTKKTTAKATAGKKKTTRKTTRKRGPAEPRGPEPLESAIDVGDPTVDALVKRITKVGGATLAAYKDPYGGAAPPLPGPPPPPNHAPPIPPRPPQEHPGPPPDRS